jgi:hypothetical protein
LSSIPPLRSERRGTGSGYGEGIDMPLSIAAKDTQPRNAFAVSTTPAIEPDDGVSSAFTPQWIGLSKVWGRDAALDS